MHADKHQSFLPTDFSTLGIKFSFKAILALLMGLIKHSQRTQINKFAIFLQFLKKFRDAVHFLHADRHQSFCKLVLSFLMEGAKLSTQNRKLVILREKCCNCFCILLWCKTLRYFTGVLSYSLLPVFSVKLCHGSQEMFFNFQIELINSNYNHTQ